MNTTNYNDIMKYWDFINEEASMDATFENDDKKHLLLFSDTIRKDIEAGGHRFDLFTGLYANPDVFVGIDLINRRGVEQLVKKYKRDNDSLRITYLRGGWYKDTDTEGKKNLSTQNGEWNVDMFMDNPNAHFFYHVVEGERMENAAPDRDHIRNIIRAQDGREWIFIITKSVPCALVKTKSRQEGGKWAEYQLSNLYGWTEAPSEIKMKIALNDVVINRANNLIHTIMGADDDDIFRVIDDPETFVKYDLIAGGDKRIEVKKYKEHDVWDGGAKPVMLAEQCKIADRGTLVKLIDWFFEANVVRQGEMRIFANLGEREVADLFSPRFANRPQITHIIKDYYNEQILRLLGVFNGIPQERWMAGIYGIYFATERTDRKSDFLIRTVEEDGTRNIRYEWSSVRDWLGFNRLKLFMYVDGNAWEYILTPGNNFVKAYQIKDQARHANERAVARINTPNGFYNYNVATKLWNRV